MHRKKFLSFLGMAVVAAPILAKEFPKSDEVKPLELSEGFIGMGRGEPTYLSSVTVSRSSDAATITNGNILVGNGNNIKWGYTDLFEGFETYRETYTSDWVNFKATPYE